MTERGIIMGVVIRRNIRSELAELQRSLKQIEETMAKAIGDKELFFNSRLILNELVCNGSIHGNHLDPQKEVKVTIHINRQSVQIEVTDEGDGFNVIPKSCENSNCSYSDHGRGLVIVSGLSDKLEVENNTVRAIKYLS